MKSRMRELTGSIGYVVGGRFGGDFLTFVFWLQMVTCLGSGLVGLSIAYVPSPCPPSDHIS